MSDNQNGRDRGEHTTDLEIEDYLKSYYPDGIDSHGTRAPTVDEVKRVSAYLDDAAALLEPNGELGHLRAQHFETADNALGCFIRAISTGDAYYAALDLRKTNQTRYSGWLGLPIPEADTDQGDAA